MEWITIKHFLFVIQYIFRPRTVGAITPSSRYLAKMMMKHINFKQAQYIVEYGPGTGAFTNQILKRRKTQTAIIIIESNPTFYQYLLEKFRDEPKVSIIHDSAENIEYILKKLDISSVDYVISGLPFTSLPKKVSHIILNKTKGILSPKGRFITFQYSQMNNSLFHHYFQHVDIKKEYRNIPPAYVYSCHNE